MAMCFVLGLVFGALESYRAPLLYSNAENFMVCSNSGTLINMLVSLSMCVIGIVSLRKVDRSINYASVVDKDISFCDFDF